MGCRVEGLSNTAQLKTLERNPAEERLIVGWQNGWSWSLWEGAIWDEHSWNGDEKGLLGHSKARVESGGTKCSGTCLNAVYTRSALRSPHGRGGK